MFFRMVYKSGQIFLPFCHNPRVWQTDRRTDRRTDRNLLAIPRLHYMQRGKKQENTCSALVSSLSAWLCLLHVCTLCISLRMYSACI